MESAVIGHAERRRTRRRRALAEHGILCARVRPGHHASLIDVSPGGALIETAHRLLPNTMIELHVETRDRHAAIRGRVLRCAVAVVKAGGIAYRGAIRFECPLAWLSDDARDGYAVHHGDLHPLSAERVEATRNERVPLAGGPQNAC